MYELYITPDLLSENEWKAIMDSIKWAKENFEILSNNTNMIGGNPGKKESYGYIHFKNQGETGREVNQALLPDEGKSKIKNILILDAKYKSGETLKEAIKELSLKYKNLNTITIGVTLLYIKDNTKCGNDFLSYSNICGCPYFKKLCKDKDKDIENKINLQSIFFTRESFEKNDPIDEELFQYIQN
jgi:hypothetical protein